MKRIITSIFVLAVSLFITASAQEVTTLYFLENAPMRHQINPAFQPISDGYVNFTPLGYSSVWAGNNSLTLSDAVYTKNGQTITALHPDGDKQQLLKQFRKVTLVDGSLTTDLLSFGFRHKERGYVHIGIMEKVEVGVGLPKTYFDLVLDGGMHNLSGVNTINLTQTSVRAQAYTEVSGGYSYKLNDQWTIGGKLKFLMGQANATLRFQNLTLDASAIEWHLYGNGALQGAAPINMDALPEQLNSETIKTIDKNKLLEGQTIQKYLTPQGYGAGLDFGFTYKPHPQVQITAALNDLGFMVWKGANYSVQIDSTFYGIEDTKYSNYANASNNYQFDGNALANDLGKALEDFAKCIRTNGRTDMFTRMLSAKLNVGVDANFCDNLLGVGLVSKTRLFNGRIYEEVTLGGSVRPCNWFNFAVSYSLVNNGKYSNIGAGLSFMPYDGVNMTLALDYIPTSYVKYDNIPIPYKDKGVNVALGFSIVWGTNPKKEKPVEPVIEVTPMPARIVVPAEDFSVELVKVHVDHQLDTDGDGFYDDQDDCPKIYGSRTNRGCPEIKKEVKTLLKKAMKGIQFETGKATIKKSSYPMLNQIAKTFINNPDYFIEVQGHSDSSGSVRRNIELSKQRAEAVRAYLVKAGVPKERMKAVGYGPAHPLASNDTKAGRELNRRVEFIITFEATSEEVAAAQAK